MICQGPSGNESSQEINLQARPPVYQGFVRVPGRMLSDGDNVGALQLMMFIVLMQPSRCSSFGLARVVRFIMRYMGKEAGLSRRLKGMMRLPQAWYRYLIDVWPYIRSSAINRTRWPFPYLIRPYLHLLLNRVCIHPLRR